ncbi:class I SAM-dependent methyltransferase [Peribacillus frigoritolerans]|uniref:class I SAM-dependent methyltransferase n=1 Tax=Peribacillus frigoritolerans TaxID=450367 RepID=UPI00227DAEAB|nr:class I SAM-dependent methyltransferase [Peribacillus frigoritolerans]MCY8939152.1 class I SAM-dependent methyltransferase [Peribacillus frigoritolerans]
MSIIDRGTFFDIFGSGTFDGEPPIFMGADVEPLLAFSRTFRLKTVIEIGIQRGETSKIILENSPWIEKYIGIDLTPDSQTTLSLQQGEVPQMAGELVKDDPRVELILKPNGTRDLTAADLPIADLILIDGDHSKEGVFLDTYLARQTIRQGGIICWHDYGNSLVPDVTAVIDELNLIEDSHICLIQNGFLCFQICRTGR